MRNKRKHNRVTLADVRRMRERGESIPPEIAKLLGQVQQALREYLLYSLPHIDAEFREAIDEHFGPGTVEALGGPWSVFEEKGVEVLAPRLRWRPFHKDDKALLRSEATADNVNFAAVCIRHSMNGLFMAREDMDRLQAIRLGKCWVVGDDRRLIKLRPGDLLPREAVRWLEQAARDATVASLRGNDWPTTRSGRRDILDLHNATVKGPRPRGDKAASKRLAALRGRERPPRSAGLGGQVNGRDCRGTRIAIVESQDAIHVSQVTFADPFEVLARGEEIRGDMMEAVQKLEARRRRVGPKYRPYFDTLVAYIANMVAYGAEYGEALSAIACAQAVQKLAAVRHHAGPKYRKYLDAIVAYMVKHNADYSEALRAVARAYKVTPNNIDVMNHYERKRGRLYAL